MLVGGEIFKPFLGASAKLKIPKYHLTLNVCYKSLIDFLKFENH